MLQVTDALVQRPYEPLRGPRMFSLEIVTLARLLVDGAICQVAGASDVFDRGFVTYSNRAKQELLGVPGDLIADLGAVSEPVARMMAEGALEASNAHLAVAITGVAGPTGGTRLKPVGTVHIATARTNQRIVHEEHFFEDDTREGVQLAAVQAALS